MVVSLNGRIPTNKRGKEKHARRQLKVLVKPKALLFMDEILHHLKS